MTTAALQLPPAPALVPADHVHDLIAENAQLLRDLKSLRTRCRTLTGALNDGRGIAPRPRATFTGAATVARVCYAARLAEVFGEVPAIRFSRNEHGVIVGVELAALVQPDITDAPSFPELVGGMEVVYE